jgi:macrolide transport system ATP-binding/permease protein
MMHTLFRRLVAFCRRNRLDADLADEIDTHLELRRQALIESGLTPTDASREARRQFGNVTAIRERSRDEWGGVWLSGLFQDLRFGIRQVRSSGWLSTAVIATIALGTGLNGAIFFFINEALLGRSVLPDSDSLVWLDDGKPRGGLSFPDYASYRERARGFDGLTAFAVADVAAKLPHEDEARAARTVFASGNHFTVLRTSAARGRTFDDADDRPSAAPVAVISDTLWTRRFNRDPSVLGRSIEITFTPFTIVGVLPAGFSGPRTTEGSPYVPDIWIPMSSLAAVMPGDTRLSDRAMWWDLHVIGRLLPGVGVEQVRAELRVMAAALDAEFPGARPPRRPWARYVDQIDPRVLATQPAVVVGVLGTVTLGVLVIACANVAGLLLARVSARRREVAVRLSLGAGRSRIIRQFLAEGLILAAVGTMTGLAVARWTLMIALSSGSDQTLAWSFAPDLRVIGFGVVLALVATVSTGWMPARQASKTSLLHDLTRTSSPRVGRLRDVLIGIEVAIALVLLLGTALLVRGVMRSQTLDPGMPVDRLVVLEVDAGLHGYTGRALEDALQQVRRELAALPGVTGASLVSPAPFSGNRMNSTLRRGETPDDPGIGISIGEVSPDFLGVAGIPVVRGRPFTAGGDEVVVSERTAALLWPGRDPLGARVTAGDFNRESYVVVGIARDTAYLKLRERDAPFMFRSGTTGAVLLRTDGPASSLTRAAVAAAARVDRRFAATARTVESEVAGEFTAARAITSSAAAVGMLALLVALGGVGAATAQHVAHRTHEIGVRMALGASRRSAVSLVVRRVLLPVVLGTIAGLLIASRASVVLTQLLYGVSPTDALAFFVSAVLIVSAAALAAWLPARRAASIDPLIALRAE